MQLPTRTFGQIVETLRNLAENTGSDKRRLSRMEVQTKVQVGVLVNGQLCAKFTALSRDLSQGGVGLFISVPVERGQQVLIEFPRGHHERSLVVCTAMFGRMIANGIFSIGAEFTLEADTDLVAAWDGFDNQQQKRIATAMMM
jgi:hypothetical protein